MGNGLDDLRIARADDDDGQHGGGRDEQAQIRVRLQRHERRFRAVARRRQAVRAQADPREQGDQRRLVEQAFVGKIPRPADHHVFRQDHQFAQIHRHCGNAIIAGSGEFCRRLCHKALIQAETQLIYSLKPRRRSRICAPRRCARIRLRPPGKSGRHSILVAISGSLRDISTCALNCYENKTP